MTNNNDSSAPLHNPHLGSASRVVIALDAMGGDNGVRTVVPGARLALERHPDVGFLFYGDERQIAPLLDAYPDLKAVSEIVHTDVAVNMADKPSVALRKGRRHSSMWKSIEAVKLKQAALCVSAGNTGALMAMARFCLPAIADIDRPAIAAIWPTLRGESIVLDMGANIGATDTQLIDYAIMGGAMARALFDIERPLIGLLNIGVEEVKGLEYVRNAGQKLRELAFDNIEYCGFVEGDDIGQGRVDVVVTEGFSGNIALKTAEGTAKQIAAYLRGAMSRTILAQIGYLLAKRAFDRLREKMDPRKLNGGVFLGLEGIVVKSHGSTDPVGFASAIEMGYDMIKNQLVEKIRDDIERHVPMYRERKSDRKNKTQVEA